MIISKSIKKESDFKEMNIKKEPNFVVTKIKEEPDFILQNIKKEPHCAVKEIKKEFNETETEFPTESLRNLSSNSIKSKQKITKTNKRITKAISREKKKTSKSARKSTQRKKVKIRKSSSSIPKKSARKSKTKSRKRGKRISKNVKCTSNKKEARTLLDQQSSTKLHLFGFRDELDYFPSESDQEQFKESNSGNDSIPKRTNLSRLDARKKVILALKSIPTCSSSRRKCIIQPGADENVDLLGSLLDSQALWHCKDSQIKVKDDGTVEIINDKSKNKSLDNKLNNSVGACKMQDYNDSEMISPQKWNDLQSAQLSADKQVLFESINVSKNLETSVTEVNIKCEANESSETWNRKVVMVSDEEQKPKQTIKVEIKEEGNKSPKFSPSVSSTRILTFSNSKKNQSEKSFNNEDDDCLIFSAYSESSKICFQEKAVSSKGDESDIEILEVKGSRFSESNKNEYEKVKSNSLSKTIKKETEMKKECYKSRSPIGRSREKFRRASRSFSRLNSGSRSPSRPHYQRSRSRSRSVITLSSSRSRSRSKS